jgi:hypothetical protein
MGYQPKRTIYKLDFSGTEYDGLEVFARATSLDGLMQLINVAASMDALQERLNSSTDAAALRELQTGIRTAFAPFGRALEQWNVDDEHGDPVPADLDGLLSQELPFISQIVMAYISVMSQAPPPLQSASPSGGNSPEAALAKVSRSRNRPS